MLRLKAKQIIATLSFAFILVLSSGFVPVAQACLGGSAGGGC